MRFSLKTGTTFLLVCVVAFGSVASVSAQRLKARLSGFQEVPAVSTPATGSFELTVTDSGLEFELSYSGLEANVIAAHIHLGQRGVAGGVIAFLCGGGGKDPCPQSGTVTGTIAPADILGPAAQGLDPGEFEEALRAIRDGATYANVHSEKYPNGEIRGQIGHGFPWRGIQFDW